MVKFVDAGLMSDVNEDDGSVIDEAAGGDGARLGVLDGRVDAAGGHSGWPRERDILRLFGSRLCGLLAEGEL